MTNFGETLPPLRPPRGEIPPGFWETDTPGLIALAVVIVSLFTLIVVRLVRLRKQPAPDPTKTARLALAALHDAPSGADTAGRLASVLRAWAAARHPGTPAGATSAELIDTLRGAALPADAVGELADFLRQCDAARYAQGNAAGLTAERALALLEQLHTPTPPAS